MDLSMAIAILGCIIAVLSFFFNRKDKSKEETGDYQYKMGYIDAKLTEISNKLQVLSDKLDRFDKDTEQKIKEAIMQHEKAFHSKGV